MTPDMKRLMDAAEKAGGSEYPYLFEEDKEAIVRAVLMELREPSDESFQAGIDHARRWHQEGDRSGATMDLEGCFHAMLDHILTEPATA